MKKMVVEPGTMLYHPFRNSIGWVLEIQTIKTMIGEYANYRVEWAGGSWLDNLTTGQVHVYAEKYLELQNGKR